MQTPDYNGFYTDIRVVGCVADESPLRLVNGRYQMDFEDLERRIDHDTHVHAVGWRVSEMAGTHT